MRRCDHNYSRNIISDTLPPQVSHRCGTWSSRIHFVLTRNKKHKIPPPSGVTHRPHQTHPFTQMSQLVNLTAVAKILHRGGFTRWGTFEGCRWDCLQWYWWVWFKEDEAEILQFGEFWCRSGGSVMVARVCVMVVGGESFGLAFRDRFDWVSSTKSHFCNNCVHCCCISVSFIAFYSAHYCQ